MKKFVSVLLTTLLMLFAFTACQANNEPAEEAPVSSSFKFSVTDKDGNKSDFDVPYTSGQTIGEALLAEELIAGTTNEYGLYVTTVNGITYDYEADGYWWSFYIDEDMAATGVDATNVEAGKTYSFIAAKS